VGSAAEFCLSCHARVVTARSGQGDRVLDWPASDRGDVQAQQTAAGGWQWQSAPPGEPVTFPWKRHAVHTCTRRTAA
jgi:hypothetical protein